MRRVLKPGGRLIFCDHGLAPDPGIRKWQEHINPVWNRLTGGCNVNRHISDLITQNGFAIQTMSAQYQNAVKIASFTYRGIAVPA
ncbi:MAG: hypothetical protein R6V15_03270 [Desulfotignum sp.]